MEPDAAQTRHGDFQGCSMISDPSLIPNGKRRLGQEDRSVLGSAARRLKGLKLKFTSYLDAEFPLSLMGVR